MISTVRTLISRVAGKFIPGDFTKCRNDKFHPGLRNKVYCVFRKNGMTKYVKSGWVDRVVYCESRWTPDAVSPVNKNGSRDHGLFQINDYYHFNDPNKEGFVNLESLYGSRYDPVSNAQMAVHILKILGRTAWSCDPKDLVF
jgi:hypothetical protein